MIVSGSLPQHYYIWVDSSLIRENAKGYEPAVWFGIHSHPGRVWGCHVMLECGAVYRNIPPHRIAFSSKPFCEVWDVKDSQLWDCYSREFSVVQYDYLNSLQATAKVRTRDITCEYLFTAIPYGDGFSDVPEQSKEFMFLKTKGQRLTIQPTNRVLFHDKSFMNQTQWPTDLKVQIDTFSCERE